MKVKSSFVANSSSSSFIIVSLGTQRIFEKGDDEIGESEYVSMNIDDLMIQLKEAKEKGITKIEFEYGGGYDG